MPYSLTYSDLPAEISQWPALPLSLMGDEVMPLDYRAGHTGWLLYARDLNKNKLAEFQRRLAIPMVIVSAWMVEDYQVVRLAGSIPKRAKKIADEWKLDIALLGEQLPQLRTPGLLVMDMDSTAIDIECINEITKLHAASEQIVAMTKRTLYNELDFAASLRKRIATLKGVDANIFKRVLNTLPFMPGLKMLVETLHQYNWHVAIISGGFTYYAEYLQEKLKLSSVITNPSDINQGRFMGRAVVAAVDAKYKVGILMSLADQLEIPLSQTVVIGNDANDLKMIQAAGLGIAYHAKLKIYAKAKIGIRHADLIGVLCILSAHLKHEER